jgi:hypothetical protein
MENWSIIGTNWIFRYWGHCHGYNGYNVVKAIINLLFGDDIHIYLPLIYGSIGDSSLLDLPHKWVYWDTMMGM